MFSPSTLFLKELSSDLEGLGFPVYFSLPDSREPEPFVVVGQVRLTNHETAQTGVLIEDMTVQVDVFLKGDSRTAAEEVRSQALRLLGRRQVTSQVIKDKSVGREVFHLVFQVRERIF